MSTKNSHSLTMFHGVVGIILAISAIVMGFMNGVQLFPIGAVPIVGCVFAIIQTAKRKSPGPGIGAFFFAVVSMTLGLLFSSAPI